jgi:glycosyltransferase involved in cell wall biosynthesis
MRVLWLARTLPFPWTMGDRIYTAQLAKSLAQAGAQITFVGHAVDAPVQDCPGVAWIAVPGGWRSNLAGIFSAMPLVAARHRTQAYAAEVRRRLSQDVWDAVIIDQYGMGWALPDRRAHPQTRFVFLTHDHEESVTKMQAQEAGASWLKRLYLIQNHLKTRRFERKTARACDLLSVITQADGADFAATAPGIPSVVLTPGYSGRRLADRRIDSAVPRSVVLLGSYRWSVKVANLRAFLDQADEILAAAGIELRVVGDIAEDIRSDLEKRYPSTRFTGFVDDPAPFLNARLAVLAEPIGGGFKLKLLDYIFNRLPIAALEVCAAGMPSAVRANMILQPDTAALLRNVVDVVDDFPLLNQMQQNAYEAADGAFDWAARGRSFFDAISQLRPKR